jgi:hypothetical protein
VSTELAQGDPNATQLLQEQVDSLKRIADLQRNQSRALEELKISMAGLGRSSVKIEDFNMPFFHLVGLMIKVALATIPAAIILAIVYSIIGAILAIFGIGFLNMF